jgi:formate transporter
MIPEKKVQAPSYLSPEYVIKSMYDHSARFITEISPPKVFILAVMGGCFVSLGALLSVLLASGVSTIGPAKLLEGLGYSSGFFFVVLTHSVLFTEANVLLPASILHNPKAKIINGAFRVWIKAWVGNFLGAIIVGWMIHNSQIYPIEVKNLLRKLINQKMIYYELGGVSNWLKIVISGVLGNWIVGMASFFGMMGKTIIGKFIPIFLAVTLFIAANFQHTPANMGLFTISMAIDNEPGWIVALLWNILPATIGNIIGGSCFVALPFWYALSKKK